MAGIAGCGPRGTPGKGAKRKRDSACDARDHAAAMAETRRHRRLLSAAVRPSAGTDVRRDRTTVGDVVVFGITDSPSINPWQACDTCRMGVRSNVPLVGRGEELERACAALTVLGGWIIAPAGALRVAKTSVLDELVRRVEPDHGVVGARAVEAEADLSYAAFADLTNPLSALPAGSLPDAQREALDAALSRRDGHGVEVGGPAGRRSVRRVWTVSPVELHAWAALPPLHGARSVL